MTARLIMIATAFLLVAGFAGQPSALSLKDATFRELRQTADAVVVATVLSVTCERTDEPYSHGVQTRVSLAPTAALSGGMGLDPIDLVLPGGSVPGLNVAVPGVPKFSVGESAALFLRTLENHEFALAGHGMGVYRINDNGLLTPDVPVTGGPAAGGESLQAFSARLASLDAPAVIVPAPANVEPPESNHAAGFKLVAGIAAAFALLLFVLLRRRHRGAALMLCLAVAAAGAFAWPRPSSADSAGSRDFTLSGTKWNLASFTRGRVVGGRVLWVRGAGTPDIDDNTTFRIITEQFQKWEDLPTSAIAFRQDGITIEAGTGIDDRNVVSFVQKVPRKSFDPLTLAITFQVFQDGLFIDADIVFNDQDVQWVPTGDRFSLDVVSLHEIGHLLGLDHTTNVQDVMYPIAQGVTVFSPGDVQGASTIYPVTPPQPPVAFVFASPSIGAAPLTVSFSSGTSASLNGEQLSVLWDFGDGTPTSTEASPAHTYTAPGTYSAQLTVTDSGGSTTGTATIIVGTGGAAMSVSKFSFKALLVEPINAVRGKDGFSIVLAGTGVQPGDAFTLVLGNIRLQSPSGGFVLDSKGGFKAFVDGSGTVTAKTNTRSGEFTVSLSGALLGTLIDPRGPNDTSQSGSASFPVTLLIKRGDQTIVQTTSADFFYTIKTGNVPGGTLEKSIAGKK